jgi:hypothetical protein
MTMTHNKTSAVIIAIAMNALLFFPCDSFADTASIKGAIKAYRMGGYVILINYETQERWTDGLLFKVHCKFNDKEFTFTSGSMNNVERGWHKAQIDIPDVIKKRHGSLREYNVELYRNGALIDKYTYN